MLKQARQNTSVSYVWLRHLLE